MFNTIKEKISIQIVEKKSKFIANLFPIESEEDAENKIKEIRKKYYDAKHHCFAYITFQEKSKIERCSDDGEPSGTAGAPMLDILRGNNLCNVLIVVTRYFGGILLGTGGLVRAYTQALVKAIDAAEKITKEKGKILEIVVEYSEIEKLKYYCRKQEINIIAEEYLETIKICIEISEEKLKNLITQFDNLSLKAIKINKITDKFI